MKPADTSHRALVHVVRELQQRAVQQYEPVVDGILRSGSRDAGHIEHTLDGLLDFCDHEPMLAMYKALCQHYWLIDPAAAAEYVRIHRVLWDAEGQGEQE